MHGRKREPGKVVSEAEKRQMEMKIKKYRELYEACFACRGKGYDPAAQRHRMHPSSFHLPHSWDYSPDAFALNTKILAVSSEVYTMWNYRREILLHMFSAPEGSPAPARSKEDLLQDELKFGLEVLRKDPKSYCTWHHRTWVVQQLGAVEAVCPLPPQALVLAAEMEVAAKHLKGLCLSASSVPAAPIIHLARNPWRQQELPSLELQEVEAASSLPMPPAQPALLAQPAPSLCCLTTAGWGPRWVWRQLCRLGEQGDADRPDPLESELVFSEQMMAGTQDAFSNFSLWHNRALMLQLRCAAVLLPLHTNASPTVSTAATATAVLPWPWGNAVLHPVDTCLRSGCPEQDLLAEADPDGQVVAALFCDCNDQSSWIYYRWLVQSLHSKGHEDTVEQARTLCTELLEYSSSPESTKWPLSCLAFLARLQGRQDPDTASKLAAVDPCHAGYYSDMSSTNT
eukprot:gene10237-1849_t